jgi:hypothetical protein
LLDAATPDINSRRVGFDHDHLASVASAHLGDTGSCRATTEEPTN